MNPVLRYALERQAVGSEPGIRIGSPTAVYGQDIFSHSKPPVG